MGIHKNQKKFQEIEDHEFRKYRDEREKLKLCDIKENPPKRILTIYPSHVLDKSTDCVDVANLNSNMNVAEMIKRTDKSLGNKAEIMYRVEDDMQIDKKTDAERAQEQKEMIEKTQQKMSELKRTCFNCGETNHRKADCKKPNNQRKVSECYDKIREYNE